MNIIWCAGCGEHPVSHALEASTLCEYCHDMGNEGLPSLDVLLFGDEV